MRDRLHAVDVVFTNLECCFYEPDGERSPEEEGFYAPLKVAEALTIAGVRFGFLQRTSVYWSHGHEATATYHNAQNETVFRPIAVEQVELDQLRRLSTRFATALAVEGDDVVVWPQP